MMAAAGERSGGPVRAREQGAARAVSGYAASGRLAASLSP